MNIQKVILYEGVDHQVSNKSNFSIYLVFRSSPSFLKVTDRNVWSCQI